MQSAKVFFVSFVWVLSSALAHAESEFGNIHQGNVKTGGSFYLSQKFASPGEGHATLSLSVPLEYFVVDHLSLGGSVGYWHSFAPSSFDNSNYSIGPSASFHFWTADRLSAFLGAAFDYNKFILSSHYFDLMVQLGMNYFITPAVAIVPALQYSHAFESDDYNAVNFINLTVGFSIYL